jgi:hypothetical protein
MKPEEKSLLENLLAIHRDFLGVKSWVEGPEPPDALVTDVQGRTIGVELTEWLSNEQTTPSIASQEREYGWFNVLGSEKHSPPLHFAFVTVRFRADMKAPQGQEDAFVREFYDLTSYVDESWEREMADNRQKLWNDFSKFPTVGKQVSLLRFMEHAALKPANGTKWVLGTPKGGAYDPRQATDALLDRIDEKKRKANYATLKSDYGLTELVLLVHYGIRGLLHNTPLEGLNWKLDDHVREAHANLAGDHGHFDRAFLYLAYNEGQLFTLYP